MRVHELAKELGSASKDLLARIQALGGEAKNHMSLVEGPILEAVRKSFKQPPADKEKKSEAKAASSKTSPAMKTSSAAPSHRQRKIETEKKSPVGESPAASLPQAAPRKGIEEGKPAPQAVPVSKSPGFIKEEKVAGAAIPAAVKTEISPSGPAAAVAEAIEIQFPIMVGMLAAQLRIKVSDLIKNLMGMGIFANVNQMLNEEIVFKLAGKMGINIKKADDEEEKILHSKFEDKEDAGLLKPRPPVVTLMGHVDHGKTSLLDAIRKTNVAAKEKGAITQHIGAYGVDIPGKGHVTFLDTPGHEAFTAMRARGANITDVVVLVVAADDGVMPQTLEAVDHAREAGCPIVVAVNKSDLPNANPQKVMTGLQKMDLIPEEWGGKTICVKVSAKTGQGIENLLEMLLLEAEVLELKANPDRPAFGTVIEGHISKGSGPVAAVIVQKGTLKVGDIVVCGVCSGRVRALRNDRGKSVREAGPSYAVELTGLNQVPQAGEIFFVAEDEKTARKITEKRILEEREKQSRGAPRHLSLEDLYHRISEGNFKELKLIIKADVQGSVEALAQSLEKLSSEQCRIRVIHGGVGGINESDVMLAAASDAIILGFHVKADPKTQETGEKEGVDLRFYSIIYEAVEDVRKALEGLLEPTYKEVSEGRVQIRKVFKISRIGTVGGGMVVKGKIVRSNRIRILRNLVVAFEGKLSSLKRFKDDVREVAQGYECGLSVEGFEDLREGDVIECYRLDKIATKLL